MPKSLMLAFIIVLLPLGSLQAANPPITADYRTAENLFNSARFQQAPPLYQKLLVSPPPGVQAGHIQSRIADSWFRLGSFQNALDAYRSALKDQKETARPETQYWIGFCCFLLGRDAEAVTEFLKIPGLYPDSGMWVSTAYYWAGRASERMGSHAEAVKYYHKAGGNGGSTQGRFALKKADAMKETGAR